MDQYSVSGKDDPEHAMGQWLRSGKVRVTEVRGLPVVKSISSIVHSTTPGWFVEVDLDKELVGRTPTVCKENPFWGDEFSLYVYVVPPSPSYLEFSYVKKNGILTFRLWKEQSSKLVIPFPLKFEKIGKNTHEKKKIPVQSFLFFFSKFLISKRKWWGIS
eukprot:TRINITY_DN4985_c0_g2_i1.p1 TRINITY_DN4985_c0_g2~~TRINITY_DN4985_c0_g2_i1.p1  ORF type:complete len:160 (-),score=19.63 TRINITY_DN4985_c0_g2_i1:259-738(-)